MNFRKMIEAEMNAQHRQSGYVVSYDGDDHFVPLCLIRTYDDIDCVAIYYSGEYAKNILKEPWRVKITNAEGVKHTVSAVACNSYAPLDGVMVAIEKEGSDT